MALWTTGTTARRMFVPAPRPHTTRRHALDFITGALPNVMFIAGLIAIGIGLGIEFKIVEIKGELSKQGRIGAIGIGAALVLVSIYLYTRPPQTATAPAMVQPSVVQANLGAVVSASQPSPTQAAAQVAATAIPPTATAMPPTATNVPPTATAVPPTATNVPPTATVVPPTVTAIPPTAVPAVKVPDIRGKNTKGLIFVGKTRRMRRKRSRRLACAWANSVSAAKILA
jgi:hypothetical protein